MKVEDMSENQQKSNHKGQPLNIILWEAFGTCLLCIGVLQTKNDIATALTISLAVIIGAPQCGAHYNPAVTLSNFLRKNINVNQMIYYFIGEFLGSLIAGILIHLLVNQISAPYIHDKDFLTIMRFMISELLGTFLLTFFLNLQTDKRTELTDDVFIFGIYFFTILFTSRQVSILSGGVINPAVIFSLELATGLMGDGFNDMQRMWVFLIAQILGTILSWVFYYFVYLPNYKK